MRGEKLGRDMKNLKKFAGHGLEFYILGILIAVVGLIFGIVYSVELPFAFLTMGGCMISIVGILEMLNYSVIKLSEKVKRLEEQYGK